MKAQATALWGLLWITKFLDIPQIQIYGDSRCMVDHILGKNNIQQNSLQGWLKCIQSLCSTLKQSLIQHISRAYNKNAAEMSKKKLLATK